MLDKKTKPILWFNIIYIFFFTLYAIATKNYEFIFYVSIVVALFILLLFKHKRLGISYASLWRLSIWGLMHMMGGNIPVNDSVLYNLQLIPVLLKYDQLVHAFGFGSTALVAFELLRPYLKTAVNWTTITIIIVMAGLGAGSLNEILEFIATVIVPETNVGGYLNTSLDMIFNLLGACIAAAWIRYKHIQKPIAV